MPRIRLETGHFFDTEDAQKTWRGSHTTLYLTTTGVYVEEGVESVILSHREAAAWFVVNAKENEIPDNLKDNIESLRL